MKLGVAVRCFMFMIPGSLCRTLNSRTQNNTFRTYFRNTKTGLFKRMSENEVRCAMHESYFDSSEQRKAMSVSTTLMFIISFLLLVFDSTSFPMLASTIGKTTTAKNTLPLSRFRIEGLQADHLHASHSYISTCFTTCRMSHDASYLSQQSSFCTWLFRLPRSAKRAATQAIIGIIFTFGGVYRLNAASAPIHAADSGIHSPGHIPSSTYNLNGRATGSTTKVANMVLTIVDTATNSPDSIAYDRTAVSTAARMPSVATSSKSTAAAPVIQKKPILGKLGQLFRREAKASWKKLRRSLQGTKQDSLIMLIATSIVIPVFKSLNTSPIVGFMLVGTLLGPSGLNWVKDLHMVDKLGELGIVFFLFEMGLELSLERLKSMRKDVFGLGTSQFALTALVSGLVCKFFGFSNAAAVTAGGSLALSSSAFVLQLLKDKGEMGTRHGRASFGILLLQDLAVVPLLIVVELLSRGGAGLGRALMLAALKGLITLSALSFLGRKLLNPIFSRVAKSHSQEAFLSAILATVLLMSFVTHGIGLSDTLGAFLAGLLLSETSYKYQIESDIAPFRGLLLGLFFITVGFSIDAQLVLHKFPTVVALVSALIAGKATIITLLSRLFGIPMASALHTGLLTAQGGELAFVAFAIAEKSKMISPEVSKLLLTTVALSMASTPLLAAAGEKLSRLVEQQSDDDKQLASFDPLVPSMNSSQPLSFSGTSDFSVVNSTAPAGNITTGTATGTATAAAAAALSQQSSPRTDASLQDFVFICGYGRVGQLVCEMLDRKCIPYVVLDSDPQRAREARNKGLPVYYGDIGRPEVLKGFHLQEARACVVTLSDMSATNKAVVQLRKLYPVVPIVARAKNREHQQRLENMFDEIHAMAPVIPEDSVLLTLPFAGAVLRNIGVPKPEIDAIMEEVRWQHFEEQSTAVELLAGSAAPDNPYFLPGIPAVGASSGSKVGSTGGGVTAGGGTSGAGSSGRGGGAAAGGGGGGVAVAGVDSGGDEAVFSSALLSQGGGSGSDAGVTVMNDVVRIRDAGLIAKAVKIALKERKQQEQQQQACSNSTNHTVVHDDVCDNDHAEVYPAAGA